MLFLLTVSSYLKPLQSHNFYIFFTSDTGNVQLSWAHPQHPTRNLLWHIEYIHRFLISDCFYGPRYVRIFIYVYIPMFQSRWHVTRRMLCMSSGQLDSACIRSKKLYKYCSVSRTNRSFRVSGQQYIVTSSRVSLEFFCACFFLLSKILCPLTGIKWLTDCNGLS